MTKPKASDIDEAIKDWIQKKHHSIINGKDFYTQYDVVKILANEKKWNTNFIVERLNKNKSIHLELKEWLENVFWHFTIAQKNSSSLEMYRNQYIDLGDKTSQIDIMDDIPIWKQLLDTNFSNGFTINNPQPDKPEINNPNDQITNFGKESDYEDDLQVYTEEYEEEFEE